MKNIFLAGLMLVALSGCVTPKRAEVPDNLYKNIVTMISKVCVIRVTAGTHVRNTETLDQEIIVTGVYQGTDNWMRGDFATKGLAGNIYFNTEKRAVYCGTQGWRESKYSDQIKFTPYPAL